jgi:lysozyme
MAATRAQRQLTARRTLTDGLLVEGCDVSHFQGDIDWSAVASAAKHFVYIKATDGVAHTDERYATNYSGAGAVGILRGAYHFFRHGVPGAAQAAHFLSVASPKEGDLPPVLDIEDPPADQSVSAYLAETSAWICAVGSALAGQAPVIYCSPAFWSHVLNQPDQFAANPLWVAHYTSQDPTVPSPWNRFTFWQYSDSGSVAGISAKVDLDRFHGSMDDLSSMVLIGSTTTESLVGVARPPRSRPAGPTRGPAKARRKRKK